MLQHLLNHVWPNIFEPSPHVIKAVFEAIEAHASLGGGRILLHVIQGSFIQPPRQGRLLRLYNNIYVYSEPQMVTALPSLPANGQKYSRPSLDFLSKFVGFYLFKKLALKMILKIKLLNGWTCSSASL